MEFRKRIQGDRGLAIFRQLQKERIPMRIHVLGRGYERLTIVTGVENRNGRRFVLVDLPGRFESEVPESAGARVQLEFGDAGHIPHSCRTVVDHVEGNDLWLLLPEAIERVQRRRHFRVEPPQGTRIVLPFEGRDVELPVLNISLGGGLVITPAKGDAKSLPLQAGMNLRDLRLLGAMEEEKIEVGIQLAEVIRVDKVPEQARLHFAFQFLRMHKGGEQMLDRFIYYSQRRLLKKRSLLLGA